MPSIKKLLKSAPRMRNTLPQNITRGNGVKNPQKAEAYVGRGVLKNGDTITAIKGSISPVPNGPLIKKKGPFKGSTLKSGGKIKPKASNVSKRIGSAKTSIGNMRFAKKKK